jgi:hypothetical protein
VRREASFVLNWLGLGIDGAGSGKKISGLAGVPLDGSGQKAPTLKHGNGFRDHDPGLDPHADRVELTGLGLDCPGIAGLRQALG